MSEKSNADLTTEISATITSQTTPESITPTTDGAMQKDIVDSMWNKVDDLLILPPANITKAALAALIGAGALNNRTNGYSDKQWLTITDRNDGFPLVVQIQGSDNISPIGWWIVSGKPLLVCMDYVNGMEGETLDFKYYVDDTGMFVTVKPLKIFDGDQGVGKVLVSDANGVTSWQISKNVNGSVENPAGMSGAVMLLMGLNTVITPGKSGNVLINISGEYTSSDTSGDTRINLYTGTGSAPSNGTSIVGPALTIRKQLLLRSPSATLRSSFAISIIVPLTVGVAQWIDIGLSNAATGAVQVYNISLTAFEQ